MPTLTETAGEQWQQLRAKATATPGRRRAVKVFAVLFALWLLFCLFAWLAGPTLLRNAATGYVEQEFGHKLVIQDLRINPLKLALTIEGLSLADSGERQIVGFRSMVVDVDITSLFRAMAILDEYRLDGLTVNVERLSADRFNFSDLADRLAKRFAAEHQPAGAPPPAAEKKEGAAVYFLIRHLDISEAALRFADHTRTPVYESWMRPLNLRMDDLTSRPESEAPYNISATLGTGGTVAWQGDLTLEPLSSKGAITLTGFGLSAAYDYIKDSYGFALPKGTLDARIDYFADFSGTQSVLRIDDGSVEVKGLEITDLDEQPLFAFDSTRLSGVNADVMASTAGARLLETRGGHVHVVLEADGSSNIQRALLPRKAPAPAPAAVAAAKPAAEEKAANETAAAKPEANNAAPATDAGWKVALSSFAIRDYALNVTDRSTKPEVQLGLTGVEFETGVVRLPDLPAIPFTLAGNVDGGGHFAARGNYTLEGGLVDVEVNAESLPLAPVSPYLASVGRITLLAGTASWKGRVRGEENLAKHMQVSGSGGLRGVSVRDDVQQQKLASLKEFAIEGLDYDDRQPRVAMKKVTLAGLDIDVTVDAKGVSNVQRVMTPAGASAQSPAPAAQTTAGARPAAGKATAAEKTMAIRLDSFVIRDGRLRLRDNSPDLAFSADLSALNGKIDGLSTDAKQQATVQIDGMINRYAPLSVSGKVNPLAADTFADVQVRLTSLDLSALTPYTVTYVAYPLARGNLGVELDWKVAERKFDAKNRVVIKGLALGEKQQAPRALKLPVKLGVALLTNRDGDADLQVPAYGELDDPQFRYGRVVLKALGNLITRAATAPFAALGGLGGDKPDIVEFAPGGLVFIAGEYEKLGKLATSLQDKPMLTLAITGAASADSDRLALREQELGLRLKREWLATRGKRGMTIDQVDLDAEDRSEMLARVYRQATGQGIDSLRDDAGKPLPDTQRDARASDALLATITVDDGALRQLARDRSQKVKDTLLASGLAETRLVIVDGKVVVSGGDGSRVPTALALEAR